MKRFAKTIAAALMLAVPAFAAMAHEFKAGSIEILHPASKATLPGQPVGGGFFTIVNHGSEPDRLVSITSPVSGDVQMHEMKMENEVMQMRRLPDGIEVPAGATVRLEPGGYHVMFMGITRPFKEGEKVPATLNFEKAGPVPVEFNVEAFRAANKGGQGGSSHEGH